MKIRVAPYQDSLKQQVFSFTQQCFSELGKDFEPEGRHSFYNDISTYFAAFWCMLADDAVVGTVALKKLSTDEAELKALYLFNKLRGRGLGYRLLNTALAYARKSGCKSVVLDSMSQYTDALRLYEKAGFQRIERFNDNPYADVFMKLVFESR